MFNADNRDAWQKLIDDLSVNRPSKGKRVRVTSGKHKEKIGYVLWHGHNKFYDVRYKTDAQLHLMDMTGREGFRVQIDVGGNKFFVDADKVEVLPEKEI